MTAATYSGGKRNKNMTKNATGSEEIGAGQYHLDMKRLSLIRPLAVLEVVLGMIFLVNAWLKEDEA